MVARNILRGASPVLARHGGVKERLLTVGDVAEMCQVHRKTVTRAITSGRLRAARLGARGAYRLRPEDVDEWVARSAVEPGAPASSDARRPGVLVLDVRDGRLT
jgi:excisionase family DNA binding protein